MLYDIVEEMKTVNSWIDKIYEGADSPSFTGAIKSLSRMSEVIDDFKRNLKTIQTELNRPAREQAAVSRAEKEEFRKQRWEAKQRQREMNRHLWRSGRRHLFASGKEYIEYKAAQASQIKQTSTQSKPSANPSCDTSTLSQEISDDQQSPVSEE